MSSPSVPVLNLSSGPASQVRAITPADATDLAPFHIRALWVGGAGNLSIIAAGDQSANGSGTAVTITGVPAGTIIPIAVKKVMTATTATAIVGLI
jgi:hypothetical protein